MTKIKQKENARMLRKKGFSYGSISEKLNVSKSTVSLWCSDIKITKNQENIIRESQQKKGTAALLFYNTQRKMKSERSDSELKDISSKEIDRVSERDLLFLIIGLYWGEGYKKNEFGFTNSDSNMIKIFLHFLFSVWKIPMNSIVARVSINSVYKNDIQEIETEWSQLTQIPLNQFTKPSFIQTPLKKEHLRRGNYKGTIRIKILKGSKYRKKILYMVEKILDTV